MSPSHPDRVRRNNCPEHEWRMVPGVSRIDSFHFVLDGYWCINCDTTISRNEHDEITSQEGEAHPKPALKVSIDS